MTDPLFDPPAPGVPALVDAIRVLREARATLDAHRATLPKLRALESAATTAEAAVLRFCGPGDKGPRYQVDGALIIFWRTVEGAPRITIYPPDLRATLVHTRARLLAARAA